MAVIYLFSLILVASLCGMTEAQSLARRSCSSSCNFDDLNILLTLARALDESENSKLPCKSGVDVEEIIMKLINALVYTTVSSNNNGRGGNGNNSRGSRGNDSDEGLIDLGLLNPNDHDNVLKLDLAKQKVLGVGLGATN